jgi:hypothetical protein
VSTTTAVDLCVQVTGAQASSERGHAAQWKVSAWTTGGNVPDATLQLQATPASGGAPGFSSGCGKDDGTSSCDLGAMDATSAKRQLKAQLTVPVDAPKVTSVRLTVTGKADDLTRAPVAAAAVAIAAPPAKAKSAPPAKAKSAPAPGQTPTTLPGTTVDPPISVTVTSPLPVGSLPSIGAASPTLSPGGNASNLFPTLDPKQTKAASDGPSTRPLANTSALPQGASIIGAQLTGLAALALAFILAVTGLSFRRRSAAKQRQEAASGPAESSEQPDSQKDSPEAPKENPPADEK